MPFAWSLLSRLHSGSVTHLCAMAWALDPQTGWGYISYVEGGNEIRNCIVPNPVSDSFSVSPPRLPSYSKSSSWLYLTTTSKLLELESYSCVQIEDLENTILTLPFFVFFDNVLRNCCTGRVMITYHEKVNYIFCHFRRWQNNLLQLPFLNE